jgi:hypothetical protein
LSQSIHFDPLDEHFELKWFGYEINGPMPYTFENIVYVSVRAHNYDLGRRSRNRQVEENPVSTIFGHVKVEQRQLILPFLRDCRYATRVSRSLGVKTGIAKPSYSLVNNLLIIIND